MPKSHPHPQHPTLDYHKVTDFIYIGTNQCCQTHFDERLIEAGIRADISLEKMRIDAPYGIDYYLWMPVADGKAPTLYQMELGVAMLQFCVKHRLPVYVHCREGHGRAPALVAAYLMSTGMTSQQAVALIKKRRPITHLNQRQTKALEQFEKII